MAGLGGLGWTGKEKEETRVAGASNGGASSGAARPPPSQLRSKALGILLAPPSPGYTPVFQEARPENHTGNVGGGEEEAGSSASLWAGHRCDLDPPDMVGTSATLRAGSGPGAELGANGPDEAQGAHLLGNEWLKLGGSWKRPDASLSSAASRPPDASSGLFAHSGAFSSHTSSAFLLRPLLMPPLASSTLWCFSRD